MRTAPSANGSASGSTRWRARCASCCRRAACRCSTRPGKPFHDPEADDALFEAIEKTVRPTGQRRLVSVCAANINDPAFADAVVEAFGAASPPVREAGVRCSDRTIRRIRSVQGAIGVVEGVT